MFLGLRTAINPVTGVAGAKRWYEQVLGTAPYFDQPFYVGFSAGGFELGLLPDGRPGVAGPQSLRGAADAEAAYRRVLELGAAGLVGVKDVGEGINVAP